MEKLMVVIHENCDLEKVNDRSLPNTSYVVEYEVNEKIQYDIVMSKTKTEVFDFYWDKYREKLKKIRNSKGTVNPRNWGFKPKEKETKGRR